MTDNAMEISTASSESRRLAFGGHETFVFRQGWLKKGVDLAAQNPTIFTHPDALVYLGVGKNMVRSIRYWCLATGVLEAHPGRHTKALQPTRLGMLLFGEQGWDPYLEDIGTLWLIHWQLVSDVAHSLVWHLVFTTVLEREFTKQHLVETISRQFDKMGLRTTPGIIDREVDVCLRTYVAVRTRAVAVSEDTFDCPLVELGLIRPTREERLYSFAIGPKALLPAEVFGYALLHFLAPIAQQRRTVAVDECLYRPGSPGQAFKLDENSVIAYLETLEEKTSGAIRLNETAGLRQIYLHAWSHEHLCEDALNLLRLYYE